LRELRCGEELYDFYDDFCIKLLYLYEMGM
jgi:hypothetical protein